ncbi:alpha 1,2-mannosyltransferase 2.4.1 [Dissophora globulifera]|nr:alpha 1,2-mannosyltransferase 2.4.1 [Dissophora globulifera]
MARTSRLCSLLAAFILGLIASQLLRSVFHRSGTAQERATSQQLGTAQGPDLPSVPLRPPSEPLAASSPLPPPPPPPLLPAPPALEHHHHRPERVNAAFVILLQNKDLHDMRKTMQMLESTFNRRHGYPYVFLNNVPFTEHFKTHIQAMTTAPVKFGLIPREHWSYPASINQTQAALNRKEMEARNVPYGESESYRHMCRYESGFIFRHELVQEFDYYWRVEPGVTFSCELDFDPFMVMKTKKYKYGFTIALPEFVGTIPTLWENVRRYMQLHPEHISKRNSLEWISYDKGETYNNCHFWSNFEIVDLNFFRSKAYMDFFSLLDEAGGFFYERWGDAPVHSIAAALMLDRKEIHFFNEIGYRHGMYEHCPESPALQLKCACDPKDNTGFHFPVYVGF